MPSYYLEYDSVQDRFHRCRSKIQIMGGGFGNGKTTAAVAKAITLTKDYPGAQGLIARATYPKLNGTIRKEFMNWCPAHWIKKKPTQEDNSCYMHNGTVVHFRYVAQRGKSREDGSTTSNLLSASYDWIIIDQIEDPEIEYKDFLDMLGRLRGNTAYRPPDSEVEDPSMPTTGPRWLVLTANPARNWFYRKIVQPYITFRDHGIRTDDLIVDADTKQPIIGLFEGSTYTNARNLPPDYIRGMEASYKGQMKKRFIDGEWGAFEGLVYPSFDIARHMITREQAMKHLSSCLARHVQVKPIESYDFGMVSPSCYLLGFVDDLGRVIVLDGFYKAEFDYALQPGAVFALRDKYVGQLYFEQSILADPACFRRQVIGTRETGDTIAKIYGGMGLHMVPASNDILAGVSKVNTYLTGLAHVQHVTTGEFPGPLIYFVNDLTFINDEFQSYYWKRNPFGQYIDEPIDKDDHAMDAIKYMLARLPSASEIVVPRASLPPSWKMWREIEDEQRSYV
jgi:phage terminase large subunit